MTSKFQVFLGIRAKLIVKNTLQNYVQPFNKSRSKFLLYYSLMYSQETLVIVRIQSQPSMQTPQNMIESRYLLILLRFHTNFIECKRYSFSKTPNTYSQLFQEWRSTNLCLLHVLVPLYTRRTQDHINVSDDRQKELASCVPLRQNPRFTRTLYLCSCSWCCMVAHAASQLQIKADLRGQVTFTRS